MAIDLSAGKGAVIQAPIQGTVASKYIDGLGNTTLVIENKRYKVTLLHGNYTVEIDEYVKSGQPVGFESNLGNTTDMQGRSCRNRDCGYHTHLNVFDKAQKKNVNPLTLINP
jgi:murein DD-endopeptidase MepM/ murein hydrolase activator NlpD